MFTEETRGFLLKRGGQLGRAWFVASGHIHDVPERMATRVSEQFALFVGQRQEDVFQLHAHMLHHLVYLMQHRSVFSWCCSGGMSEDALIRLQNLRSYCAARKWGPADLASNTGRSKSQCSDMLRGQKSFGEKIARDFEQRLGLPRNWFDQPHDGPEIEALELHVEEAQRTYISQPGDHKDGTIPHDQGNMHAHISKVVPLSAIYGVSAPVVEWAALGEVLVKPNADIVAQEWRPHVPVRPVSHSVKFVRVPDARLEPALQQGDLVLIDPLDKNPARDQVTLFQASDGEYMLMRYRPLPDGDFEAYDAKGIVLQGARHGLVVAGVLIAMQRDRV